MCTIPDTITGKRLNQAITVVAILMILYHFFAIWFPIFNPILHQNVHLGFCFVLLLLTVIRGIPGRVFVQGLLAVALIISIVSVVFVHAHYERLTMWAGFPEPVDVVIGIVMVVLVLVLTFREWGYIFPTLVLISVSYAFWGHHITGPLSHPQIEAKLILSNLGIGLEGIYGMMLNASANLIFLFIIFGSLFQVVGIDKFFVELGRYFGGYVKGGSAQTAIVSSSFVGMCTGSAPANVALTGSYTIPLMKKTGFKAKHAAAIEAAASSGGQLTPPIMGVAVFIMAGFLGVSYGSLMITALIPAIFYYSIIIAGAVLIASRDNIPKLKSNIDIKLLIKNGPVFIIPMAILTCLLILHYTPGYASFFAILAMLVIAVLRRETRPGFKSLLKGLTKGAIAGASIGIACAAIGMFMKMLSVTGAASKLAALSQTLSGGNLVLGLIYAMALSIILGCAMPIVVAYVICAIVVSPVLVDMGLPQITAHFFVFYFAVLSAVTPPVAAAAMVGSKIAESNYVKTGYESLKLILPFFLVPFFLTTNPIIMIQAQPFFSAAAAIIALIIACTSVIALTQGYFLVATSRLERVGFLLIAILATIHGLYSVWLAFIVSVALFALFCLNQAKRKARLSGTTAAVQNDVVESTS